MSEAVPSRSGARAGAKWTAVGAVIAALSQASILILAGSLLDPAALGHLAIALFLIGLFSMIVAAGNDYAIVQMTAFSKSDFYRIIGRLAALSLVSLLGALLFLTILHPWLHRLEPASLYIALMISFADGLALVLGAVLQRDLRYRDVELVGIVRNVLTVILGAVVLLQVPTLAALLMARLAAGIGGVVFCLHLMRGQAWDAGAGGGDASGVARDLLAKNVVNYLSRHAEIMAMTPQVGFQGLGFYDFSRRLVAQPRDLLANVVFRFCYPLLSKSRRIAKARLADRVFRMIYQDTVFSAALVGFPMFSLLLIVGPPLILLLLGAEWAPALPVFGIFAATALFQLLGNGLVTAALTANGQSKIVMKAEIYTIGPRFVLIFLSSLHGIAAVALTSCLIILLKLAVMQHILFRRSAISYLSLLGRLRVPALAGVAAAIPALACLSALPAGLAGIVATAVLFSVIYVTACLYQKPGLMTVFGGAGGGGLAAMGRRREGTG